MSRPRLALVPGEPAGIGPELCIRALQRQWDADLVVFGDRASLQRAADGLGCEVDFQSVDAPARVGIARVDTMPVDITPVDIMLVDIAQAVAVEPGTPDPRNARAVIDALQAAAAACLRGDLDGLVTGPVHKAVINAGGIPYRGTTELLAGQAGCPVVMMLANDIVRVALATTHLPLRAVADAITSTGVERSLRIVHASLCRDFGIADPVIAVLGLNPHAGEQGHMGREEIDVIEPVLALLRGEGMRLPGPLPADTAFLPAKLTGFDALLAMYHDQGLPVLKYSGFEQAVNLTLGLPYPRVAVDHGTALELAGKGEADPSSLFAAIRTCALLAKTRAVYDASQHG